ncbi:SDR family NAD(P)-dependent oxidoreductase [Mycobacterium sp. pUA109]|uniref:SDR family NAD(P)-dependent oxidoreductase n=1 Tax=Mycobacterium sp. pUA109 TaxID=3238982 RepID=UPI00351AD8A3
MTFTNKVALVTGAASGIGRGVATILAAAGATVMVSDIDAEGAAAVADDLERAHPIRCDVGEPEDVHHTVQATVERFGRLDILVNNAGMEVTTPLVETTPDQLANILRVNIVGVFNGIRYAAPPMAEGGGGAIVSVASAAGLRGVPLMSAYGATKAAVINLTQSAALELRPANIRVNCVCPGLIATPMMDQMKSRFEALSPVPINELVAAKQGRMGEPAYIARAVAYLASDAAEFVSGVALPVDNAMAASLF